MGRSCSLLPRRLPRLLHQLQLRASDAQADQSLARTTYASRALELAPYLEPTSG